MVKSEKKRVTFTAIAVILVGVITGLLLGTTMSGGAPPTKTFNVIPYHWGYAIFDEDWNEIEQMVVKLGTTVRLVAYPYNIFSQELQAEFMQRTIDKGLKTKKGEIVVEYPPGDPKIKDLIVAARIDPETANHGVFIAEFNVDFSPKTNVSIWKGGIASFEFTPDALGRFELKCSNDCGPGHEFFSLLEALIVE